ncbi:MAG: hypothetical protein R3F61_15490 [Myxococcota bacterium]
MDRDEDPELKSIEARLSEVAKRRRDALAEAESLTKGVKGFLAGWRGNRESRLDALVEVASECKAELESLKKARDVRIAALDPEKGAEMERAAERQRLLDRAAELRQAGGPKADMLDKLERERRTRTTAVEDAERAISLGKRALTALSTYLERLHREAQTNTSGVTLVGTEGSEAREALASFVDRVAGVEPRDILVGSSGEVDSEEELAGCTRNLADAREWLEQVRGELEAAERALRPIEAAYRTLLATAR